MDVSPACSRHSREAESRRPALQFCPSGSRSHNFVRLPTEPQSEEEVDSDSDGTSQKLLRSSSGSPRPPKVAERLPMVVFGSLLLFAGISVIPLCNTRGRPVSQHVESSALEEHALYTSVRQTVHRLATYPVLGEDWDQRCYFEYNGGHEDMCFCQLAGNRGCAGEPCRCPQGCGSDVVLRHNRTVTFKNKAEALYCGEPLALLTIPVSYFSHMRFLKTWCPTGMWEILTDMLRDGYISYKERTGQDRTMQCFHAASSVSAAWLHLHTFCEKGTVDRMPSYWKTSWCHNMTSTADAPSLAAQVLAWAEELYGPLRQSIPTNCSDMGCHEYGPKHHCSCNVECHHYQDCCHDYRDKCHGQHHSYNFEHTLRHVHNFTEAHKFGGIYGTLPPPPTPAPLPASTQPPTSIPAAIEPIEPTVATTSKQDAVNNEEEKLLESARRTQPNTLEALVRQAAVWVKHQYERAR